MNHVNCCNAMPWWEHYKHLHW